MICRNSVCVDYFDPFRHFDEFGIWSGGMDNHSGPHNGYHAIDENMSSNVTKSSMSA